MGREPEVLAVEDPRQPMPDVVVDVVLLALVEDLVPSIGVEATLEGPVSMVHLAGGQALDRRRLTARRVFGPRADKDWKI